MPHFIIVPMGVTVPFKDSESYIRAQIMAARLCADTRQETYVIRNDYPDLRMGLGPEGFIRAISAGVPAYWDKRARTWYPMPEEETAPEDEVVAVA